jgi:hypothetical protein
VKPGLARRDLEGDKKARQGKVIINRRLIMHEKD